MKREGQSSVSETPAPFTRMEAWLLGAVLAWSLVFRLWYGLTDYQYRHYWDERFSFENSLSLLQGELAPANGYYQLISYAPQTAVFFVLERLSRLPGLEDLAPYSGGFTASAYVTVRSIQVLYGTAVLLLTYLVARWIFDRRVAIFAVLACGFTPFYLWACAWFKPDALLALLVLLALHWTLRAFESPSLRRYLRAGAGVGLAMSSKLTGGLAAVPLVVATAVAGRGWRRRIWWLSAAGATALVVFLVLNPHWRTNLHFLGVLTRQYARNAAGLSRLDGLGQLVGDFLPGLQGLVFTIFFWLGFAALVARPFVPARVRPAPRVAVILIAYPIVFTAAYFFKTSYFKGNNFLSVVPMFSMIGAWAMVQSWDLAQRAWRPLQGRAAAWTAALLVSAALALPAHQTAYRLLVPTTEDAARIFLWNQLKSRQSEPRIVISEDVSPPMPAWENSKKLGDSLTVLWVVDQIDDFDEMRLQRTDGEIMRAEGLSDEAGSSKARRLAGLDPARVQRFKPRFLELRGPEVIAIARPWSLEGSRLPLEIVEDPGSPELGATKLPAGLDPGETLSLVVWVDFEALRGESDAPRLILDDQDLELHWASRLGNGFLYLTERLTPVIGEGMIHVATSSGGPRPAQLAVDLYTWSEGPPTLPQEPASAEPPQ